MIKFLLSMRTDHEHPDKDLPLASMVNIIVDILVESRKLQRTNW